MFPAPGATPSPTLQQRYRGSRTAAYPPGTHRPAAGSQRAELHHLQGPAGRDRHLFSVSGTAAASKHEVVTIAPRRWPSSGMQGGQAASSFSPAVPCGSRRGTPLPAHDDRRVDGGTESGTASVLLGVDLVWGEMTPGVEWWDGWWERIPMSPGQGEINDGVTPSPIVFEMLSIRCPGAWRTRSLETRVLPPVRHAQNKRQETAKLSSSRAVSGRSDSLNPPVPVPVGGSGGGRKFDAPPAAPPPTTMTDAVAPMDDGMEHENQSHKHPAYTIPGKPPIRTRKGQWHRSSRGTPVAWSRPCDWVLRASATCREWHGKQSPAAKKQPSASSFPLCLAQRTTRLCCIGVGLRGRRIKCQSTPFLYQ